jgi:hypothetical protein
VSSELNVLSSTDVTFHGLSFTDYNGRLFTWNGALYRAIPPERIQFCQDLFANGVIQDLVAKQLFVATELTLLNLDHNHLVLKHRTIPWVAYPQEWCDAMLKDAALLHLEFCLELDRYNLTTGDAHPLNILFDRGAPLFIDFGSIDYYPVDLADWPWPPYEQFCHSFVYPLRLMAKGHGRIARWLLRDYEKAVQEADLAAFEYRPNVVLRNIQNQALVYIRDSLPPPLVTWLKQGQHLMQQVLATAQKNGHSPQARRTFLQQLHQEVTRIPLRSHRSASIRPVNQKPQLQQQTIDTLLSQLQPTSVLEVGCTTLQDSCALAIASQGYSVVYLHPDEDQVRTAYALAKQHRLSVLPLILDFVSPSCDLSNAWFSPACDRLQCDLVIALASIEYLVFEKAMRFDTIVNRLAMFCKKWLLVEFMPRQDLHMQGYWSEGTFKLSWYTLEHFIDALRKQFSDVEIIPTIPEQSVLLLCRK